MNAVATTYLDYAAAKKRMGEIVIQASRDPKVINLALSLIQGVGIGEYGGELRSLASAVRDEIRYSSDTSSEDLYKYPLLTWKQRAGDCNNKVILFCSLARAVGFPTRFCFVFDESRPEGETFPDHVFASVDLYKGERSRRQWIPVELVPLPDPSTGFPWYTLPVGSLPRLPNMKIDCSYEIDEAAYA